MLIGREFKVTYTLSELFIYIEQWTYNRAREQSVCDNAYWEVVQSNLHPEGTEFSIHVHTAENIL